ncbi:uncharacterized protein LOC113352633 [Papaver somniferum]|uniref:uncharacterized protein LOC113352633 n=1 Tax=Papaver somniferum TaxID=3469 RepID=UPI000E6F9AB8|nr:uncharacterized protein LOC113352633 [Papaver somniferum]
MQEVIRQNRHDNRVTQARLKRPMQQDQVVNEQILREFVEMREMMTTRREGGRIQLDEEIEEAGKTPFARQIQMAGIPPKCNLPAFTNIFDGTTCAIQHIKAYVRTLLQWEDHDAFLYKYFPASLSREALKWFEGLPTGTIRSFNHLQSIFLGEYINNNVLRPGIEQAFGLQRRTNEDLRSLTTRWRTMCSEMAGRVDERNLILALINALFATDFLYTQIFRIKETISMTELREYREEYIALEQKQKEIESYPVTNTSTKAGNASLLPKITNTVESTSQGRYKKEINEDQQKMVATDQGKLDHFLVQQQQNLPPPPPEGRTQGTKTRRNIYLIEVGAKAKNLYCNSIIHSFKNIEDFHDNVLSRVYARDSDGREILNLAKVSPLKDWQKQLISFNVEEMHGGGEPHESLLVVKLEINPRVKTDEDEEEDTDTWAINRILIDPGSSVNILFYHTYKTMGGRDDELILSTYKIYGLMAQLINRRGR